LKSYGKSRSSTRQPVGSRLALNGGTVVVGAVTEDGDANSTAANPNDDALDAVAVYVFR